MARLPLFPGPVLAVLVGILLGLTLAFPGRHVWADRTDTLSPLHLGGVSTWDFDFDNQKASPHHVDFPVTIVFTGHATIPKVEHIMDSMGFPYRGGAILEGFVTGGQVQWQRSDGVKTDPCASLNHSPNSPYDLHLRLYGGFHSKKWGQWVIGTSHEDHFDCGQYLPNRQYGWNEHAEQMIAGYFRRAGYQVISNDPSLNFGNKMDVWEGNHFYHNNGIATRIVIP